MSAGPYRVKNIGVDRRSSIGYGYSGTVRSGPFSVQVGGAGGRILFHDIPLSASQAKAIADELNAAYLLGASTGRATLPESEERMVA